MPLVVEAALHHLANCSGKFLRIGRERRQLAQAGREGANWGSAANSTFTPGRSNRAMRGKAIPLGVPVPKSIAFALSSASGTFSGSVKLATCGLALLLQR